MALELNGTSIPSSGKMVCNGTSLKQLNIDGTKVWQSGLNLIAQSRWTATNWRDGYWSSSTSELAVSAKWRTDWWNYMIVRSTDALNLSGFAQITLSWWNSAGDINFHGFIGLSTNADLDAADWHNTNISHVFVDAVGAANMSGTNKVFSIPSSYRKNGVYLYVQRNYYESACTACETFHVTRAEFS